MCTEVCTAHVRNHAQPHMRTAAGRQLHRAVDLLARLRSQTGALLATTLIFANRDLVLEQRTIFQKAVTDAVV